MSAPIPIDFKLAGSNKVRSGHLVGYRTNHIRISVNGEVTYYAFHCVDWIRKT